MSAAPQQRNSTAAGAALLRAAHRLLDRQPLLLDDPYALPLSGLPDEAALRALLQRMQLGFARHGDEAFAAGLLRQLRCAIVLRNRYAEDQLEQALAEGVRQYVLLGAGLDSFALRRPNLARQLRVFELDLPQAQQAKRERLQALGLTVPGELHFVAADLERQSPMQALAASALRRDQPVFFSWLGVTGYLSEPAVYATLRDLATAAPGSRVVFSYGLQESLIASAGRRIHEALKADLAARGEPAANSGFDPAQLAQRLRAIGYGKVEDLDVQAAQARYFAGRGDGLQAPPMTHHMLAVV
jgi:methyltransferase (TIGR00027 family)